MHWLGAGVHESVRDVRRYFRDVRCFCGECAFAYDVTDGALEKNMGFFYVV